jgi:hypothetical protein
VEVDFWPARDAAVAARRCQLRAEGRQKWRGREERTDDAGVGLDLSLQAGDKADGGVNRNALLDAAGLNLRFGHGCLMFVPALACSCFRCLFPISFASSCCQHIRASSLMVAIAFANRPRFLLLSVSLSRP